MIGKARENRHMTFCEAGRLAAEAGAKDEIDRDGVYQRRYADTGVRSQQA